MEGGGGETGRGSGDGKMGPFLVYAWNAGYVRFLNDWREIYLIFLSSIVSLKLSFCPSRSHISVRAMISTTATVEQIK